MIQGLAPARLEYWMDLNNVLSQATWAARPAFIEGVDRPLPLLFTANGGEAQAKLMLGKKL
jgi:L-fucose isomerase